MQTIRFALVGLGHVGRNLLRLFEEKGDRLRAEYGVEFVPVLAADSSGVAESDGGIDSPALRRHKEAGGRISAFPGFVPRRAPADALAESDCDLLFEASPVNLKTGEPGLGCTRAMLARGGDVVLANKGPLVLAFRDLHALAAQTGGRLAYSATVCGALPVINILQRDYVAAEIRSVRGIFNSTTNFILGEMLEGRSFDDALAEAQQRGIAEPDPSLDVDGWDTANKLVIIANSALGIAAQLGDVEVEGIRGIKRKTLEFVRDDGGAVKLVATAEREGDSYRLSVEPAALEYDDFLATCSSWEMGIEIQSDIYGRQCFKIWEREPLPTAAAMLRDAVNLHRGAGVGIGE